MILQTVKLVLNWLLFTRAEFLSFSATLSACMYGVYTHETCIFVDNFRCFKILHEITQSLILYHCFCRLICGISVLLLPLLCFVSFDFELLAQLSEFK